VLVRHVIVGEAWAARNGGKVGAVLAGAPRDGARLETRRMRAGIEELAAGKRPVLVDVLHHGSKVAHVAFVPDARRDPQRVVALGVNRALLGVDRAPAALGLDAPMRHLETGVVGA